MIFEQPKCETCKHKILGGGCLAFSEIPDEIYYEEIDHNKIIEGQKGNFIFEKKEDEKK